MKFVVITAGCAECAYGDSPPLVGIETVWDFKDIEDAKNVVHPDGVFIPHPFGGEYEQTGQGAVWILPLETIVSANRLGDEDEAANS